MGPIITAPTTVCAAAVRQQAEILMQRASLSSGAEAIVPLSVAAAAFRSLQDGTRAAEAGSRLIRIRFSHALERLFEELLGNFFDPAGPVDSVGGFRLVLSEADDAGTETLRNSDTRELVRYAQRFVDRAENEYWHHLTGWSSRVTSFVKDPETRAGLFLFEAWLGLEHQTATSVSEKIETALRCLNADVPFFDEKAGRLHFYAGIALISDPGASMGELQRAALHLWDAWSAWDKAESDPQPARKFLAYTYRRLARKHTEGNPQLRTHFEKQASRAEVDLPPRLPQARVVNDGSQSPRWFHRFWK